MVKFEGEFPLKLTEAVAIPHGNPEGLIIARAFDLLILWGAINSAEILKDLSDNKLNSEHVFKLKRNELEVFMKGSST